MNTVWEKSQLQEVALKCFPRAGHDCLIILICHVGVINPTLLNSTTKNKKSCISCAVKHTTGGRVASGPATQAPYVLIPPMFAECVHSVVHAVFVSF